MLQDQVRSAIQRLEQSSSSNSVSTQSEEQTRRTDQNQRTSARISNTTTRNVNDESDHDGRYAMGEISSTS